jgi:hypothetical protein
MRGPRIRIAAAGAAAAALLGLAAPASAQSPKQKPAPAPAAEPPKYNTWYAQALAHSEAGLNVTHFWSKDENLRAETVIAGRRIVTIVTADTYYAYDLLVRTGIAVKRSPLARKQDAERSRPFGNEFFAVQRQGAERVDQEILAGRQVAVYQVTDDEGRRRVWVTEDDMRLPLRLEVYRRATSQTFRTDFLNWQRGLPIAEEFFRPEPGVELAPLSFEEYVAKETAHEVLGPVPVLYTDLLHGY